MPQLVPTILSADYLNLNNDIKVMKDIGIEYVHIDVMDGAFVDNITFGHKFIEDIKKHFDIKCDAHLMVSNPEKQIDNFINAGADIITIHFEATSRVEEIIEKIKQSGRKIGISINPDTNVENLKQYIEKVDLFLIMSVNPGYGGQKFIDDSLNKIDALNEWKKEFNLSYEIEVDGGIKLDNVDEILKQGATMIVAGSVMYEDGELSEAKCRDMFNLIQNYK